MTYLYENNAAGTLASGISNSATSLTLNVGQAALFPNPVAPDTFFATLTDAATQTLIEIVSVTAVVGNIMTIVRAQDGTSALSWNAGDILSQRTVAAELRQWQGIVPIGGIIMWSGAANAIPENWALCNGSGGTPNLEGNFVIGAGGTYAVGATGGSATALLAHTHTITDNGHQHPVAGSTVVNLTPGGTGFGVVSGGTSTGTAVTNITINSAGSSSNTLPPYYALCYIMRVT